MISDKARGGILPGREEVIGNTIITNDTFYRLPNSSSWHFVLCPFNHVVCFVALY